jgi:hypothetical protein
MIAQADFDQDVLMGLNVRPYNFLILDEAPECDPEYECRDELVLMPFVVEVESSEDDDYYHWFPISYHRTRKGAEMEAAWHEDQCPTQAVQVREAYWAEAWTLDYKPLRD